MTEVHKEILESVATYLNNEYVPGYPADEDPFEILRPCGGCVPDGYADDDLKGAIRKKFACIYWTAIEQSGINNPQPTLVIDPEWEDATTIAIVCGRRCLMLDFFKAWNFNFETDEAIIAHVEEVAAKLFAA